MACTHWQSSRTLQVTPPIIVYRDGDGEGGNEDEDDCDEDTLGHLLQHHLSYSPEDLLDGRLPSSSSSRRRSTSSTGPTTATATLPIHLPGDIVCEIIKHCSGVGWSYERKAQLCLVNKADWLTVSRVRVSLGMCRPRCDTTIPACKTSTRAPWPLATFPPPLSLSTSANSPLLTPSASSLAPPLFLQPARRSLYRDIHLDYRHEVEQLWRGLRLLPANAALVSSLFVNGDAAHVPALGQLFRSVPRLRMCTFFDFELHSLEHQHELCEAITSSPTPRLESLSFQVLPPDFMLEMLQKCANTLKHLHIYRVALDKDDGWPGEEGEGDTSALLSPPPLPSSSSEVLHRPPLSQSPTLQSSCTLLDEGGGGETGGELHDKLRFRKLEHVEMFYTGDVSPKIFKALIADRSESLRVLKISFERSYPITRLAGWWRPCRFKQLRELELKHFHLSVVQEILDSINRNSCSSSVSPHHRFNPGAKTGSLERLSLSNVRNPATPTTEEPTVQGINVVIQPDDITVEYDSARFARGDDADLERVLHSIPGCSLRELDLLEIRSEELCRALPQFLSDDLMNLTSLPKITVLANAVDAVCATATKREILKIADARGLRYSREDAENCCLRIRTWSAPSMF